MGATITVGSGFGLDIRNLDFSNIYYGYSYTLGSTVFRASYGAGDADEFRGSGFRYNGYGEPTAGTVTSYAAFMSGYKVFTVDGMSIAATSIMKAANTYSTADDLSLISTALKGNDTFKGGNAVDFVSAYAGNDTLYGNGGNDTLKGGTGNDKIVGGAGRDYLFGETGADTFIYKSVKDSYGTSTRDTIYDFMSGDKIDLSAIDANSKATNNQAFKFIDKAAFHGVAGELRYEKKASDTYIYADVNGDKVADLAIHLDDAVTLSKGYFVL